LEDAVTAEDITPCIENNGVEWTCTPDACIEDKENDTTQ
jgi:hypothetical protein